jgi:peroxiredoxin family protein
MKTKIARHISPGAIAIALFLAVALLTRGATVTVFGTNDGRVGYYAKNSPTPATADTHGK